MSRVEDSREEQRLLEKRLAEKRAEQVRVERNQNQFGQWIKTLANNKLAASQAAKGQEAQTSAQQKLLIKKGIATNQDSAQTYAESDRRLARQQQSNAQGNTQRSSQLQQTKRQDVQRQAFAEDQQNPSGSREKSRAKSDKQSHEAGSAGSKQGAEALAAIGMLGQGAPIQGVGGASASAPQAAGSSGAPANLRQMIDTIVRAVRKGIDTQGIHIFDIELKDDCLAGALLRVSAEQETVNLKVFCHNPEVSRLLESTATASDLAAALRDKGLRLEYFEVNHHAVLG